MDMYNNLLAQISSIVEQEKILQAKAMSHGEYFNMFEILGVSRNEVRLHSAFIADLLNPKSKHGLSDTCLKCFIEENNIDIDLDKYEVKLDGKIVKDLKPKEIQLLYFFMSNKNQVFTREQLLDKVWGYEYFGGTRTVDVHIKSLREKLKSKKSKWEIKTIWNVGYKFEIK